MTNFFAQISTIFHTARLSFYGRKSLLKILLAGVLLWGAVYLFVLANKIPYNKVYVEVNTQGPKYVDMDLKILVGSNSNREYLRDSSMNRLIPYSGESGREWIITSSQTPEIFHDSSWDEGLNRIVKENPQVGHRVDSINACVLTLFSFESNSVLPFVTRKLQERYIQKSYQGFDSYCDDSLGFYLYGERNKYEYNRFEGFDQLFFKDSIRLDPTVLRLYSYSHSSFFNINNPLYGNVNRELKDVSRSYTLVSVKGFSYIADAETNSVKEFSWHNRFPDGFKLTVDFGSPISLTEVQPEPDIVGLTYVTYTDPEKLKKILYKSDLLFFVKYLENENRQSMRLFWLTTIITALATWIVTVAWKWIEYSARRRRFAKRWLQQGQE